MLIDHAKLLRELCRLLELDPMRVVAIQIRAEMDSTHLAVTMRPPFEPEDDEPSHDAGED